MPTHVLAVLAALLASVATPQSAPPAPDVQAADSIVRDWVGSEAVAGAVLRVTQGGRVLHEAAYGWADLYDYGEGQYPPPRGTPSGTRLRRVAQPAPLTPLTLFDLASVTKVVATTFAVMLLVDEGRVALDAPVHAYLPDFRGSEKDGITVRHLLTHRAGLLQWVPTYYHATDADAAYAYIRDLPLGWPVGEGRHYSDLGFMLLGRVVERVSGEELDAFLEDRLYGPLGLRGTRFRPLDGPPALVASTSHGNPFEYRMVHDSTFGYRIGGDPTAWDGWRDYTLRGEVNDGNAFHAFGGVAGHAGLFSTAGDLSRLVELLLAQGTHGDRRYLGPDVVRTFLAEGPDAQALGWQVPSYAPAGSFFHTGFTGTYVLGVPERDLAVVLLTNRQNTGVDGETRYVDVGPLQRAVADALIGGVSPGR